MALAIKFKGLLNVGVIAGQSELAKLVYVTQPRITQIMNLLNLALDIQEQLLLLPRVMIGKDPVHENDAQGDDAGEIVARTTADMEGTGRSFIGITQLSKCKKKIARNA